MWLQLGYETPALLCFALLGEPALAADIIRHPHQAGFTGSLGIDYDGSRYRTAAFDVSASAEWGSNKSWLNLSFDGFTDFKESWRLRSDAYATLELGHALYRNNDERLYLNATLDLDVHSQLAIHGGDITPSLDVAKGLTDDWWTGGSLAAVLATDPDEGNRRGYASLVLWTTYLCGWLPNESDSISLNIWAATNEEHGADRALFIATEYQFDLTDSLEASISLGTDPSSPWDHLGLYATAGLTWRF